MDIRPKVRNAALVALAAAGATAWATSETMPDMAYAPSGIVAAEQPVTTSSDAIAVDESLSPTENVVTTADAHDARSMPVVDRSVSQPPITVETQRLSNDERIQAQVMDKLASNPYLSGKIGVESNDAVVRLSGWTTTAGMAYRAQRDASSIVGVRYVQNEIRPRIGGSV
ncbi:MAG: BON domain-containing protein [Usitatibacter sp.]